VGRGTLVSTEQGGVIRVAVRVPIADAETARAAFLELAPGGFEEVERPSELELAAYVHDPVELTEAFPDATTSDVADGWADAWRSFHRPVIAGGVWIGPPWEQPPPDLPAVMIDPGRAFGTGAHPTTRLCVELLARCKRGSLLDVGCGSGVLALAGARLGFDPVAAIDADPIAVAVTRANAAVNGLALVVSELDALSAPLPQARVAVANVLLRPVESILARLETSEAITSGYLAGERPSHPGWELVETRELDGWAGDRFRSTVPAEAGSTCRGDRTVYAFAR